MPSRPQPRDNQGRFIHSTQPQQEERAPVTPQVQVTQPSTLQCILLAASTPLVSDIPMSEFISNITQAYHHSSPIPNSSESPPSLPFVSESALSPPICYVPPPRFVSNTIPAPVFDAPRFDPIIPPVISPLQLPYASFNMPRQSTYLSDDKLSYTDDNQFVQLPPPLPLRLYQAPPQHLRQLPRARPSPQLAHPRALP